MAKRWDTDAVGHGVADGRRAVPEIDRLRGALTRPAWVAEDPDVHLVPHVRRAADALDLEVVSVAAAPDLLTVTLTVPAAGARGMRELGYALVGSIAECATFVRESAVEDGKVFEVATGMLDGDSEFATHGHLLRFELRTRPASDPGPKATSR